MTTKGEEASALTGALLETARDMRAGGLISAASHEKITLRLIGETAPPLTAPVTSEDIRALRLAAHMSQAVFARSLNLTTGYVSQLERGAKNATGATLALLNLIRRVGVEALL